MAGYFLHCCASSVPSRGIGDRGEWRSGVERKGPVVLITNLAWNWGVYICICPLPNGNGNWLQMWCKRFDRCHNCHKFYWQMVLLLELSGRFPDRCYNCHKFYWQVVLLLELSGSFPDRCCNCHKFCWQMVLLLELSEIFLTGGFVARAVRKFSLTAVRSFLTGGFWYCCHKFYDRCHW